MSGDPVTHGEGEVRLDSESIEAIARRLAELLGGAEAQQPRERLISAEEVSQWWGVSRRWVYDHADELGAHRLGAGRRPRLRFDPEAVAAYLGRDGGEGDGRGSAPMRGDRRSDSLSARGRAMVGGKQENGRGGARTPPDPAPV